MPINTFFNIYKKILFFLLLGMFGWSIYLSRISDKETLFNQLYSVGLGVMYVLGMIPAVYQVMKKDTSPTVRKIFLYFALGQLAWALGVFSWLYYNFALHIEIPYPSAADILFFAFNGFAGIACWYLLKQLQIKVTFMRVIMPFLVIFFIYIFGVFSLTWHELISGSLLESFINFMYPICDAFLFALAFIIFNNQEKPTKGVVYLVLALLLQVIGDILYSIFDSLGTYWNGSIPDVLYAISGFFIALAIVWLGHMFSQPESKSLL